MRIKKKQSSGTNTRAKRVGCSTMWHCAIGMPRFFNNAQKLSDGSE